MSIIPFSEEDVFCTGDGNGTGAVAFIGDGKPTPRLVSCVTNTRKTGSGLTL